MLLLQRRCDAYLFKKYVRFVTHLTKKKVDLFIPSTNLIYRCRIPQKFQILEESEENSVDVNLGYSKNQLLHS